MIRNGVTIANFVSNYFRFMSDVVRIINNENGDNFIRKEELYILADRDDVPIENLLKLRIAKFDDQSSAYIIDKRVVNFVSFCNNEFALSSPEAVKKYHYSLARLYDKFIRATEANDIILYAEQIISELIDFSDMLESNIQRLLDNTLRLKEQHESMSPSQRFHEVGKLIDEYIEPLKEMVEDREDTILPLIRNIMSMAAQKRVTYDRNIDNKMHRLSMQANSTHEHIENFGKKIVSELYTLRKIQKSSLILSNAITWLKHKDQLPPGRLLPLYKKTVHSKEFFFEAIDVFDTILSSNETIQIPKEALQSSGENNPYFHFDKKAYLERLEKDMPVEDFFGWLYHLMKERGELTYPNYCTGLSLIDNVKIKFGKKRALLDFDTFNLNVPISSAKERK